MPNTFTDSGKVNLKLPAIADESTVKRTINQKPDEIVTLAQYTCGLIVECTVRAGQASVRTNWKVDRLSDGSYQILKP